MAQEILVNIVVNSGKAEANLGSAKNSVDKLAAAQRRLKEAESATAVEIAKVNIQTKQQIALNNQAAISSLRNVKKGSTQFRTQVGLNNAILQEAGRAASDLRFGFNGVANNVGQLASLFGSLINTSDNVATSFKNLGRSLLGTGGVLIAVQLLIAYGDKIYEFFTGTKTAIDEETESLKKNTEELQNNLAKRKIWSDALLGVVRRTAKDLRDVFFNSADGLASIEAQERSLQNLSELLGQRGVKNAKIVSDETIALDARLLIAEKLISVYEEEDRRKSLRAKQDELLLKLAKARNDQENVLSNTINIGAKAQRKAEIKAQDAVNLQLSRLKVLNTQLSLSRRSTNELNKDIEELQKRGVVVTPPPDKKRRQSDLKEFEEGLFRIQKTIDKYNEEADKINVRTLDERLDLEEEYAKKEADTKLSRFEEVQVKRLEEYKERVEGADNANELIRNAELDFQKSMEDARIKHGNAIAAIEDGFITKRILAKDKEAKAIGKIERSIENTQIDRLKFSLGANEEYYKAKLEQVSEDTKQTKALIKNAETLKLSDLEVANLRKDLFNLQNQQIDLNLQKEIDAIDTKTTINEQYVSFVEGISGILKTIAGENEAIQKAALIVEKGAAIAGVVVRAQQSIATARAMASAIPAILPPGIPNPSKPIAEADAARNIALTKVSSGIAIAGILATTLTSFKSPSGGQSGGGGASVQAPAFNVVGASPLDLLMVDISNKLKKPIPAYVTAKGAIETLDEYYRNVRTGSNN